MGDSGWNRIRDLWFASPVLYLVAQLVEYSSSRGFDSHRDQAFFSLPGVDTLTVTSAKKMKHPSLSQPQAQETVLAKLMLFLLSTKIYGQSLVLAVVKGLFPLQMYRTVPFQNNLKISKFSEC